MLGMNDLDGSEMFEEDSQAEAVSFADTLKRTLCNQIDGAITRRIEDMNRNEDAFTQLMQAEALLGTAGYRGGNVEPLMNRIKDVMDENRKLKKKIQETDELLLAKRHYLPLIQKLVEVAQSRNDQETINRIHAFMVSGNIV